MRKKSPVTSKESKDGLSTFDKSLRFTSQFWMMEYQYIQLNRVLANSYKTNTLVQYRIFFCQGKMQKLETGTLFQLEVKVTARVQLGYLKFILSKKATKIQEIFAIDLTLCC